MSVPPADLRIGSYRILQPLATGGMSSVYRAIHTDSQHEVALKILTRTLARNSTLLQRFLREARSAETLEHPNIVTIYDRGIDQGRHYLVLEYVAGGDFHEHIQRNGPLSVVEAASVIRSVADGLKYAAGRGLIHRDIKPSNILRARNGQVKIIDLGLALQGEFEDERVTREGTTVGTVDYMAPEQARDSRATSLRSDLYSLGCTFYYFLTGIPPYPGGDITDKLTRHAKSAAPDVRDLRSEVPVGITAIIQKMMAKRPEDRFASYDDLISALDAVPLEGTPTALAVESIPLVETSDDDAPASSLDPWPSREPREVGSNGSQDLAPHMVSLAELVADDLEDEPGERSSARPASLQVPPARHGLIAVVGTGTGSTDLDEIQPVSQAKKAGSASAWIIPGAFVCLAFIILAIGLFQSMSLTLPNEDVGDRSDLDGAADQARRNAPSPGPSLGGAPAVTRPPTLSAPAAPHSTSSQRSQPEAAWIEPVDRESSAIDFPEAAIDSVAESKFVPEWARAPAPDRIDGPLVVVRRVCGSNDLPDTAQTLHTALDRIGGTVELADEGPLVSGALRVAGETRLIRARKGYRSIVRIEASSSEAMRRQPAVFVVDRKNVTLDGIDLIVNVGDLPSNQTALFSCTGANLTLRNCSITVLNQRGNPAFTVFRAQSSGSQATHIRLEESLVRGWFTDGFALAGGRAELVLRKSVVLGGSGALIRINDAGDASDRRIFLVQSLLAGPGPIIDRTRTAAGLQTRPLVIRAYGSVLARLHGVGIASVISSSDSTQAAGRQIDWVGDRNLFAGWKGFFASGNDHTVIVADLAAVRSTWNSTEQESQEILAPWPYPPNLAEATPAALSPFLPNREGILRVVAQPRAGLFEKTVAAYPAPVVPEPVGWAFERTAQPGTFSVDSSRRLRIPKPNQGAGGLVPPGRQGPAGPPTNQDDLELTFNTETPPWKGDLGAFLKNQLSAKVRRARIRVVGSGRHWFSPVQLQPGLRLEIRVDSVSAAEPLSWSPAPQTTGPALIELRGGALVLSNVVIRHEESSRLEHLIHVEDGCLVLSHCQLISQMSPGEFAGDLIAFRTVSTQPRPSDTVRPLFSEPVDRPVCRIADSALITGGTALKAELGRGLVALSQCSIAAGAAGIELIPSNVARSRFDADLSLDHCTLTSERSIIRFGPWPGWAPGPDRPWLITSRNCAFLAMYDRPNRETVLLRADTDALACGTVFWQGTDDVADADCFIAAGEGLPSSNRPRDVQHQWVQFWGHTHMRGIDGPRGAGSTPSVRFRERLRPGHIEPAHLILDPGYHPGRSQLAVGPDVRQMGSALPPPRYDQAPN